MVVLRAERVAEETVDSSLHRLNKLRIGYRWTILLHSSILNVTAPQFRENRLSQCIAIEKGLAMRAPQAGERLLGF